MRLAKAIHNEALILRTLRPSEASPIHLNWLSDPDINSYLEVRFNLPRSLDDLANYISEANESLSNLLLGIFLADGERHIGNIKLGPIDWNHQVGDIGFLIGDRTQWGKGYASKSIVSLSDYAFSELGLAKLTAGCYANNHGSRCALKKAGFLEEGRLILQWKVADQRQDGVLLGRLNSAHLIT
jgi:[ribosomal protein S5]-alanine N-acetyltransferase